MLPQRRGVGVGLLAATHAAGVGLVRGVNVHVLLTIGTVGESTVAAGNFTLEWFFTCMDSFVNFEIFGSCEYLATARERTGEWFLSRVNPHVVDQLVLGLEGLLLSRTLLPVTGVVGDLRSTNMVDGEVGDNIVERLKNLVASLSSLLFDPLTGHLLFYRFSHVPEEAAAHAIHVGGVHVVLVGAIGT